MHKDVVIYLEILIVILTLLKVKRLPLPPKVIVILKPSNTSYNYSFPNKNESNFLTIIAVSPIRQPNWSSAPNTAFYF